jgi:hypothetical protein
LLNLGDLGSFEELFEALRSQAAGNSRRKASN